MSILFIYSIFLLQNRKTASQWKRTERQTDRQKTTIINMGLQNNVITLRETLKTLTSSALTAISHVLNQH